MASPTVDEYQNGIMHVIRNSFLSQNYHYSNYWDVAAVDTVYNPDLEEQCQVKRRDLIHTGRTKDELTEKLLMGCYATEEDIKFISLNGLQCGKHGTTSYLGNGMKGVTLGKHADILLKSFYNDGYEQCWIVVYKVVYGRQKEVLHIQTPPFREPMQDADCHVSLLSPVPTEDCLFIQEIKAQVFLFDKDEEGDFLRRPRQCVPIACVKFTRASRTGIETVVAKQPISADTKDCFTLLRDSLAKMKESFVAHNKKTVINSKSNYVNQSDSKVLVHSASRRNLQQQQTEANNSRARRGTPRKDELDKNKSTVSSNSERRPVAEFDLCSCDDTVFKPSGITPSCGVTSKTGDKKVSQMQKEICKGGMMELALVTVSTQGDRPNTLSKSLKVGTGKTKETRLTTTRKHGQLQESTVAAHGAVSKEKRKPCPVASSATAALQSKRHEAKHLSRRGIVPFSATSATEISSKTDRKQQDAGNRVMPDVSKRTCPIEALPVSSFSCPSLKSTFSRRPSLVVSCNVVPKSDKSSLASTLSTVENGLPVPTNTSSAFGLQNCSNTCSCSTTTTSVMQKQSTCVLETPPDMITRLAHVVPQQANDFCQTSSSVAHKFREQMTLNSNCNNTQNKQPKPDDKGITPFQVLTSSALKANNISIISASTYSKSTMKSNTKTTSKTCLTPSSSDSVSNLQNSSSLHTEVTSKFVSLSKPSVALRTSDTSQTQPNHVQATCTNSSDTNSLHLPLQVETSHKTETKSVTIVPAKTRIDSFVPNQKKSASYKRTFTSLKTGTDIVPPVASSVSATEDTEKQMCIAKPSDSILPPRKTAQSKTLQSTSAESKLTSQPQTASPSLDGIFAVSCSASGANRAVSQQRNANSSPTLMESVAKSVFKSDFENCFTKESDIGKFKVDFADSWIHASSVAIRQKKLLLLQHGFISCITKQLASDLNDIADLLRASKPETANQPKRQALLNLKEINSKFTELTPICVQYKQLLRQFKDGHSVRLPELDQLYSQELTMNECCGVLGRLFSKLKTSQLTSETVPQKRSLAISWLADNKNELISCINNIKSIVENVVLTCELSAIPTNVTLQSTPEKNCVGNNRKLQTEKDHKSAGSSPATHDIVEYKQCSPVRCQVTEAIATVRSSQRNLTPEIQVTAEAKRQRLPENNDNNVEHLVNSDRSHSETRESSGATMQNAEIALPLSSCFDDVKDPDSDRKSKPLQCEAQSRNDLGRNVIVEGCTEQRGKERESDAVEGQSVSTEEKSSQTEDDKRIVQHTNHNSSAVCTGSRVMRNSGQSNIESSSADGKILREDGSLSAEHASTPTADVADDATDVRQLIKAEHDDPPNLIALPPQTIILDADDFIPPSSETSGDYNSSIVVSISSSSTGVNNNNSPSMDISCTFETCASDCLQDQGDSRYEPSVALEPESFTLSLDGRDEIVPPLLTPDCAFGFSSIVYFKSDEPPMLEANTDESSKNAENFGSILGLSSRDSSELDVTPKDSSSVSPDLVLRILGTHASTIIMNSDDLVASNSTASETKSKADNNFSVDNEARVCENAKQEAEHDVPNDTPTKESLQDKVQFSVAKETNEENDKSKEIYYGRVVGELTSTSTTFFGRERVEQSSGSCQNHSQGDSTNEIVPDSLQLIYDASKESTCDTSVASFSQNLKTSDQLERPDDRTKSVLEGHLQPSALQSVITRESSVAADLSNPTLNSEQIRPKSDQTGAQVESVHTSTSQFNEAYAALLSNVTTCDGNQSHYVFRIEPDDDFDPDSVCCYESSNGQTQPTTSARQVLLDVGTSRDGQVSHQRIDIGSPKPADAVSLRDQNVAYKTSLSSVTSTETLATVGNKWPCPAMLQKIESHWTSKPVLSPHLNSEHETLFKQSSQEHPNEKSTFLLSCEPAAYGYKAGGCPLRQSSSGSDTVEASAASTGSQELVSLSEMQQMLERSIPLIQENSCGRSTSSDDRCVSPPTVYTEPPQSPPPEPKPLATVVKQEISLLDSLVEMKTDVKTNLSQSSRRKRKREKKTEEEPVVIMSEEDEESRCSAPPQKQFSADWSHNLYSQAAADRQLKDSIARFAEFCSSDVHQSALAKPFYFDSDHRCNKEIPESPAAAAACEERLVDGRDMTRSKSASKWFSSKYRERQIGNARETNDERDFRCEEKNRLLRCTNRNLSYDKDFVSSGSRYDRSRIRDEHAERQTERRLSRNSERRRTIYHSSDDHKERRSTGSYNGRHGSMRRCKEPPIDRRSLEKRFTSRQLDVDATSRESCRRSEGRSNYRSRTSNCSRTEYEERKNRSRSTRPHAAAMLFETRAYDITNDPSGHVDQTWRKVIDPSTLKRRFWSTGHPRFRCHEECDHVALVHDAQDSKKRHGCASGSVVKSSLISEREILEETLKLNIEMLESNTSSKEDRAVESPTDEKKFLPRRGTKRLLHKTSDRTARCRRKIDDEDDGDEAEEEEELYDYQSITSSRRSKTLSRQDQDDLLTFVTNGATEREALQPLTCGRSSVASGSGSEKGCISRKFGDDKTQSHSGISTTRMGKPDRRTCQVSASAAATSNASVAPAPVVCLAPSSVTYVTEILQTSNFSTQVCVEKYKNVVS